MNWKGSRRKRLNLRYYSSYSLNEMRETMTTFGITGLWNKILTRYLKKKKQQWYTLELNC
jgi:hypothetical protein